MTPEEGEFVDRVGLFFEAIGAPRTMGRIYGWLLVCTPPDQSLDDLAAKLLVSKASVSTLVRPMSEGGLVERVPSGSRQHRYRVTGGGWTEVMQIQISRLRLGVQAAEFGVEALAPSHPDRADQLRDFRDFLAFTEQDARDGLAERWARYRDAVREQESHDD